MPTGKKTAQPKPSPAKTTKPAAKKPARKEQNDKPATDANKVDVEKYEDEIRALNDKVLRIMAEVENTRRRAERDLQDMRAFAVTGFAREMLTVQDNLIRALAAMPDEMKNDGAYKGFIEGVEVTERELLNIFERHGIKKITPKGEAFDHNLHQAMFEVETDEKEPGTVMEVIQEGYVINDRLLRPAMVGVSKKPAPSAGTKDDNAKEGEEKS